MTDSRPYTVLMTACVDPRGASPHIARADPALRITEYEQAALFWSDLKDPRCERVVMLENSGWDLSGLSATVSSQRPRRRFDAFNVGSNEIPVGVHYGFAELAMIDAWLSGEGAPKDDELLIKVTGRLTFPRLPRLVARVNPEAQFMADARSRHLPRKRTALNGALATQLLIFSAGFYREHLLDLRLSMTPDSNFSSHIETQIYARLFGLNRENSARVGFRFPISCEPVGVGATSNYAYGHGVDYVKAKIRASSRLVVPWIWL